MHYSFFASTALLTCCLAVVLDVSSNANEIECDFMVQIEPGRRAKRKHFHYLRESHVNLLPGVINEWQIGQTFQGYHINLCTTAESNRNNGQTTSSYSTAELVQIEYLKIRQAPELIVIEQNGQVRQAGWVENVVDEIDEEEEETDEIHAMLEEESELSQASNLHIVGQQAATIACQNDATWSLHRIGQAKDDMPLPPSKLTYSFSYVYAPTVRPTVYVMDTQIWTQHPQFAGRAKTVQSYVNDLNDTKTPFPPHGTHVAGIIGAARYGVQKWSEILSVVTLNRQGTGSWVNVLNGATWIAQDAAKRNSSLPAIVNLSLSGSKSDIINAAMNAMVDAGLIVVVAVGNSNVDACTQSPASATDPVKVAASDSNDTFATFSNWGACVDIISPGVFIKSTSPYDNTVTMSGTSQSSPHVAGIIASALANGDLSVGKARDNYQLKYFLNQKGVPNIISKIHVGTVNLLAQTANTAAPQCGSSTAVDENERDGKFIIQHQ